MNHRLIEKILNEVSLDERIKNGIFKIEENDHMDALREFFTKKGIDETLVIEYSNRVLEGKYPERQAYNAKGILVTFPTPEYKATALKNGTHFEKNPLAKQQNIFQHKPTDGSTPPPAEAPKSPEQQNVSSDDTTKNQKPSTTNLPVSQAAPPASDETDETKPVQTSTTAAPQQTPTSTSTPTPESEPVKEPTELPLPTPKSSKEKEMDKNVIKTMLKGDDYMLEEILNYSLNNCPYINDLLAKKL